VQDIPYTNNKPLCDLIANKPGLLSICDDCCNTAKTDSMFVMDLKSFFSSNNNIQCGQTDFTVRHYAGDVRTTHAGTHARRIACIPCSLVASLMSASYIVSQVRYMSEGFLTKNKGTCSFK